jgi:hypothetical protein
MWSHFIDTTCGEVEDAYLLDSTCVVNQYTNRTRLNVFIELSNRERAPHDFNMQFTTPARMLLVPRTQDDEEFSTSPTTVTDIDVGTSSHDYPVKPAMSSSMPMANQIRVEDDLELLTLFTWSDR